MGLKFHVVFGNAKKNEVRNAWFHVLLYFVQSARRWARSRSRRLAKCNILFLPILTTVGTHISSNSLVYGIFPLDFAHRESHGITEEISSAATSSICPTAMFDPGASGCSQHSIRAWYVSSICGAQRSFSLCWQLGYSSLLQKTEKYHAHALTLKHYNLFQNLIACWKNMRKKRVCLSWLTFIPIPAVPVAWWPPFLKR